MCCFLLVFFCVVILSFVSSFAIISLRKIAIAHCFVSLCSYCHMAARFLPYCGLGRSVVYDHIILLLYGTTCAEAEGEERGSIHPPMKNHKALGFLAIPAGIL